MKGQVFPSEYRRFQEPETGRTIYQLTSADTLSHHLYFLNSSFTPDEKWVILVRTLTGRPELFKIRFPDGPCIQLTDGPGLHSFSGCLSLEGSEVYFTRRGAVCSVHLESLEERVLAYWAGASLGECSLSPDGQWIVTAIKYEGSPCLAVVATDGSSAEIILKWDRTIIHPQFHPRDAYLIEFAGDPAPRMHLIHRDGTGLRCLYFHSNEEFIVHETFLGSGEEIAFVHWPYALRALNWKTGAIRDIARFNAWHICPNRTGSRIVCDTVHPDIGLQLVDTKTGERTTLCYPKASSQGTQWEKSFYATEQDWAKARSLEEKAQSLSWMEMKGDTVYGPQWTHPHPSFSPSEGYVIYTSDVSGVPQVYVVEVPEKG